MNKKFLLSSGITIAGLLAISEFIKFKKAVQKTEQEDEKYW
ncbi:hypothetical protein [Metabacillus lacus]|nr:hypothetical protein [Metabacillus lacus]